MNANGAAVITDERLLGGRGRPVYLAHLRDGSWMAIPMHSAAGLRDRVSLRDLLRHNPSLREQVDLPRGWQTYRHGGKGAWKRAAMLSGETFHLTYEVRPTPPNRHCGKAAGAFVNCWVVAETLRAAARATLTFFEEEHWHVVDCTDMRGIDAVSCDGPRLQYFWQAQVDGEVFVFHLYPMDDEQKHNMGA